MYHKRGTLTYLTRHRQAVIQRGNYPHPIWRPASITTVGRTPLAVHRWYLLRFTNLTKNSINRHVPGRSNRSGNTPIAAGFRQIRKHKNMSISVNQKIMANLETEASSTKKWSLAAPELSKWQDYYVKFNRWNTECYFRKLGMFI